MILALLGVICLSSWPTGRVVGTVVVGEQPVAGATVRYQGGRCAVLSGADGRFEQPPSCRGSPRLTATRPGHAIGSTPAGARPLTIQLVPLPSTDNDSYKWLDPTPNPQQPLNCGNCHAEIYREWSHSGHARSATSPRFLGEFARLAADKPDAIGVCSKCHAPTFRDDPSLDYDLRQVTGVNRQGVHCDFCHKITGAPTDKLGRRFGFDGYDFLRPHGDQQLFFGPLDDAVREGDRFGYSPLYTQSRYCASCHEGIIYGVHVYGTYSEWLASPARKEGKECQSCHMAPSGKMTNIAPAFGGIERDPMTLASHALPGATAAMLRRCLKIKASIKGNRVEVELLADNVGHRVPTGYFDRNIILHMEAVDGARQAVPLTVGPVLPAAAVPWQGMPGKVYAKQAPAGNGKPLPFWLTEADAEDTRLWPGQPDRTTFTFARPPARVRLRCVYQRLWTQDGGLPKVASPVEIADTWINSAGQ
jgi:hypothetical protein